MNRLKILQYFGVAVAQALWTCGHT